ncbi:TIGR02757 family protein [Candidatus Amoebophilus asiaticus]|nr:TIGR02757 family protein [Candidatus Amoebophilus asiaticus]
MNKLSRSELFEFLEEKHEQYNRPSFIDTDPISVPHQFTRKEDIEIAGFFTATIAWGQRPTIIKNAIKLMQWMDYSPYDFVMNCGENADLRPFQKFIHRTFNGIDCIYFIRSLRNIYKNHGGISAIFTKEMNKTNQGVKESITAFRKIFFEINGHPARTKKHVSNPEANASAKRLNMYLRWMVRKDNRGVDFGLWEQINMTDLCMPLDVHTATVARKLGILKRKQNDWKAVEELTSKLREFDPADPVKYDFALFGLGIFEKF